MKMKNSTIVQLIGSQAFGHPGALPRVHGGATPHKLGGKVRLTIASHMLKLATPATCFEKAREGIVSEYAEAAKAAGETWDEKHPKHDECIKRVADLLDEEQDVGDLNKINASDLNIDENCIDPALLVALAPVLDLDK